MQLMNLANIAVYVVAPIVLVRYQGKHLGNSNYGWALIWRMPVNEDRATNGKGHLIIIMRVFDIRRRQEWKTEREVPDKERSRPEGRLSWTQSSSVWFTKKPNEGRNTL